MIALVREKGNYKIYYTGSSYVEARDFLMRKLEEISTGKPEERAFFWRSTNNKKEHEICANLRSKNHADGSFEDGMSVSETEAYWYFHGYKYLYVVAGEIAGTGSDGEPLLRNVKALTKPSKTPNKKYLAMNKKQDKLPEDLKAFYVKMLHGIPAEYGLPENEVELVAGWIGKI